MGDKKCSGFRTLPCGRECWELSDKRASAKGWLPRLSILRNARGSWRLSSPSGFGPTGPFQMPQRASGIRDEIGFSVDRHAETALLDGALTGVRKVFALSVKGHALGAEPEEPLRPVPVVPDDGNGGGHWHFKNGGNGPWSS